MFTYPAYEVSWHHEETADALMAVERGDIKRLIVTQPPQKGKSELCSIRFPDWAIARNPDRRIILTAYSSEKAEDYSRQARDVVEGERFKRLFPKLRLDEATKSASHWRLKGGHRGYIHAAGIGGAIAGYGADILICDDPIKDWIEADSDVIRERCWNWFQSVVRTRLTPDGAIILIMTRWHHDDLIGRVLAMEGDKWTQVHCPAVGEDGRIVWPEKWSRERYAEVEIEVGPRVWQSLYQGKPTPDEGMYFTRDDFIIENPEKVPDLKRWYRAWDLATSLKESGDWTAGVKLGIADEDHIWITDMARWRMEWPDGKQALLETCERDGASVFVGVEDAAFQLAAVQDLRRNDLFLRVPLIAIRPVGDKKSRAGAWAARGREGKIHLKKAPWNEAFINECIQFPFGKHDDQVDAVSIAMALLHRYRGGRRNEEKPLKNTTVAYFRALAKQFLSRIEGDEEQDDAEYEETG